MWLSSKRQSVKQEEDGAAQIGEVTVSGEKTAVFLAGERRNITHVSPGGYHWKPKETNTVLVIKTDREEGGSLLGTCGDAPSWLAPGDIWISADGTSGIFLRKDGSIRLTGWISLNGQLISMPQTEGDE